jgi:hypothetical protein
MADIAPESPAPQLQSVYYEGLYPSIYVQWGGARAASCHKTNRGASQRTQDKPENETEKVD